MMALEYTVGQYPISSLLTYIKEGEIAIPEIQRPFVWDGSKVRNLIDSLYNGYPTGYLIIWQNPNVKLKNGNTAMGKKILIDGQQRITALQTAIIGMPVLTGDYEEKIIKIAFNPLAKSGEDVFAVQTAVHNKTLYWIPDISVLFKDDFASHKFLHEYYTKYNIMDEAIRVDVEKKIEKLRELQHCLLGTIELNHNLDINQVTDIFVRINSQGARLNAADFAMSKMAADEKNSGNVLRKAIDYFCHLTVEPNFYAKLINDNEFMNSIYADKLKWVSKYSDEIFKPDYSDMLRVSFMHQFDGRGKLSDLVNLLSGRDFNTRTYKEEIAEGSFKKLSDGILNFMNEYNYKNFILAIKSIGFISAKLLSSKMALDFAYTLFLLLQKDKSVLPVQVKRYMQKWFVLSILTARYTNSPETQFDRDLKAIKDKGFVNFLKENEAAQLTDGFWKVGLVQNLETSSVTSPYFSVYLAASRDNISFLASSAKIGDLISDTGDIHHIFPKAYLKKHDIDKRSDYNQVANLAYLDTTVNIYIGEKAPNDYLGKILDSCKQNTPQFRIVNSEVSFWESLDENCVPQDIISMTYKNYEEFLQKRRILMAQKIRSYYEQL